MAVPKPTLLHLKRRLQRTFSKKKHPLIFWKRKGQSTLVMTFDPNFMGYTCIITRGILWATSGTNCFLKSIVLKVMVNYVQWGKPKYGEKLALWPALTIKLHNIWCWNWLRVNVSTDTKSSYTHVHPNPWASCQSCADLTWMTPL